MFTKTRSTNPITVDEMNELADLSNRVLTDDGRFKKSAKTADVARYRQLVRKSHLPTDKELNAKIKELIKQGYTYVGWAVTDIYTDPEPKKDMQGNPFPAYKMHYFSQLVARKEPSIYDRSTIVRTVWNDIFRLTHTGKFHPIGKFPHAKKATDGISSELLEILRK